ncbi:MAG: sialidase family protein [Bryobacteraceae bacterium]|nr:sialidase family protein [Bryobacteraceae bacterium]
MYSRRELLKTAAAVGLGGGSAAAESWTAIQGVCAWPNLQRLPDNTMVATIFNQPCHGEWEGDLDCWRSADDGRSWKFHGRPAPHEPRTNRMNCAVGQAVNGDLVVLVSGWDNREPAGQSTPATRGKILRPWVCRSSDGGRSWTHTTAFPSPVNNRAGDEFVPFGDIQQAADGTLVASVYTRRDNSRNNGLLRSKDDGRTWGEWTELNPIGNETAILHVGSGKWLAASRMFERAGEAHHIELFTSTDDGRTWRRKGPLTLPGQITGHLAKLKNGAILLSYGNRNKGNFGVDARVSNDGGETWEAPIRIASTPQSDCGYPASVQLPSGEVVTAYYTRISHEHHYEMRVARWV